jgi:hypothetical protein
MPSHYLWALASAALLSADCSAPGFGFEAPLGLFLAVELAAALLSVALFHSEALSRKPLPPRKCPAWYRRRSRPVITSFVPPLTHFSTALCLALRAPASVSSGRAARGRKPDAY